MATPVRSKLPSQSPCGHANSRIIVAGGKTSCVWAAGFPPSDVRKFNVILRRSTSGNAWAKEAAAARLRRASSRRCSNGERTGREVSCIRVGWRSEDPEVSGWSARGAA